MSFPCLTFVAHLSDWLLWFLPDFEWLRRHTHRCQADASAPRSPQPFWFGKDTNPPVTEVTLVRTWIWDAGRERGRNKWDRCVGRARMVWLRVETQRRRVGEGKHNCFMYILWPGTLSLTALAGLVLFPVLPLASVPVSYLHDFMLPFWSPSCSV